jgi:hypothetical protein
MCGNQAVKFTPNFHFSKISPTIRLLNDMRGMEDQLSLLRYAQILAQVIWECKIFSLVYTFPVALVAPPGLQALKRPASTDAPHRRPRSSLE